MVAFEQVYRDNVGALTAYFARRTTDAHAVADLTSETFVAAITGLAGFDPRRGTPRAWLFGIARRVYAQHCDGFGRGRRTVERLAGRRVLDDDEIGELIGRIDAERVGREVLARLATLPDGVRTAIELVDLAGLTTREAAASLGVSSGALRIRLFRGRAALRGTAESEEGTS